MNAEARLESLRQRVPEATPLASTPQSWEHALVQALADVHAALGTESTSGARAPLFVPASDLFSRTYAATPWLVQGLITRGGLTVIGAEPKSGKTWLATDIALAVATGTRACGEFQAARGAVAYFFAEDLDVQVRNRLRALLAGRGAAQGDIPQKDNPAAEKARVEALRPSADPYVVALQIQQDETAKRAAAEKARVESPHSVLSRLNAEIAACPDASGGHDPVPGARW